VNISRAIKRGRLEFLWRDGHTVVQIALQLKCSAREVMEALIKVYAVPARRQISG
jgi:hypothetical protein